MDQPGDESRHRFYEELAVSHVLGGLSEYDGRIFRSHLLECSECRARVGELRRLANDLADVERDERRQRAAKAIETKRREDEEEDTELEEEERPSRLLRVGQVLGLLALIGLVVTVFLTVGNLRLARTQLVEAEAAGDLLIDGARSDIVSPTQELGVSTQVRYDQDRVAVVLDGVRPGATYGIYQVNGQGDVINSEYRAAVGTRMVLVGERARSSEGVVVSRLRSGDQERSGRLVGDKVLDAPMTDVASR